MNEDIEGFSEVSTDEIGEIENLIDIIEDAQESFKKLRHTIRKSTAFYSEAEVRDMIRKRLNKKIERIESLEMKILDLQAEIGDIKGD
jgi:predicted RNA-binding protein with EMAP domain